MCENVVSVNSNHENKNDNKIYDSYDVDDMP